jgi:hypothetical protein
MVKQWLQQHPSSLNSNQSKEDQCFETSENKKRTTQKRMTQKRMTQKRMTQKRMTQK